MKNIFLIVLLVFSTLSYSQVRFEGIITDVDGNSLTGANVIAIEKGELISRTQLLHRLVQSLYSRTTGEFNRGNFRVNGDVIDIFPGYADIGFKIHFFGDEIEEIESFDPIENKLLEKFDRVTLFPANMFVTSPDILQNAITHIQDDLVKQVDYFNTNGSFLEAKRLQERTEFDLSLIHI